jgi:hypothetical protein
MANSTEEEDLDNPTNVQPGVLSDDIIPTQDTQAINPIQDTENMEVHHHPDLHHKPKLWKEYLLEGLMIFIAVTMGFFAEKIRENISDREKEKELMQSLIVDLKEDSIAIQNQINTSQQRQVYSDSLIKIVHDGNVIDNSACFYYYGRITARWTAFSNNSRSVDQMKNGGLFRVIKNDNVVKQLMTYYEYIPQIKNLEDRQVVVDNEYRKIAVQVFDPYIFSQMLNAADTIDRPTSAILLLTTDKKTLLALAGWAHYSISNRSATTDAEKKLLAKGEELITLVKKEYQLK